MLSTNSSNSLLLKSPASSCRQCPECPVQCNTHQRNRGSRLSLLPRTRSTPTQPGMQHGTRSPSWRRLWKCRTSRRRSEVGVGEGEAGSESARSERADFSERRLAELEAERTAEAKLLEEGRERLRQLEAARCAQEGVASSPSATPLDLGTQVQTLHQMVTQLQEERDALQKTPSHQCQHWFHESSASGWKTVSQTCKRPCRAEI